MVNYTDITHLAFLELILTMDYGWKYEKFIRKDNKVDNDCLICLDDMHDTYVYVLPCGDKYHADCIIENTYYHARTLCPNCRSEFKRLDAHFENIDIGGRTNTNTNTNAPDTNTEQNQNKVYHISDYVSYAQQNSYDKDYEDTIKQLDNKETNDQEFRNLEDELDRIANESFKGVVYDEWDS